MIEHLWSVLCSRAVVDRYSNNVSIQNALEQLKVPGVPTPAALAPLEYHVVTLWAREELDTPCDGRMRLRILMPSGKEFGSHELRVDLTEHERARSIMRFYGFPIEEAGTHRFVIELQLGDAAEWQLVKSLPLVLRFEPADSHD